MGFFFRCSRAAHSAVLDGIWLKFELVRDIIDVLVTCKYEEDPIKNEGARVLTRLYVFFFRRSRAANSEVSDGILPKFELIQAFIVVLFTCKNEEDSIKFLPARMKIQSKMKALEWSQHFSHYKPGDFFRRSRAANSAVLGPIWPNFELVPDVMDVLVTCKDKEDPIKNESARVVTRCFPLHPNLFITWFVITRFWI